MEINRHRAATVAEMATLMGVSRQTLDKIRSVAPENGPPFVRLGTRVIYYLTGPNSLETWLAANVQGGGMANVA